MSKYIKYFILGTILLFILHFEILYIGTIKISHLWKGILLIYFLFSVINKKQSSFIYTPLIWIAAFQLVNIELINNPLSAFINFSTVLILPIIGIYILRFNYYKLKQALLFFSSFFILSFIPYQLGLLESIREGYDLSAYGGTIGLVGPFQSPHGAAISLASSLIVILYFWFEGSIKKIYLTLLFILGFYFLISTYVRTGLAMLIVASIPILFYFAKKQTKTLFQMIFVVFFIAIIASNWIFENEVLMNRITGKSQYRSEDTFANIGSGRGGIYIASVEIFVENPLFEKLLGMGRTEQIKRLNEKVNMQVVSHNGFLDLLLQNGLIGLFVFFVFLYKIQKIINSKYKQTDRILVKSLFWSFVVMTFVQNYTWITFNIIFMLAIAMYHNHPKNFNAYR